MVDTPSVHQSVRNALKEQLRAFARDPKQKENIEKLIGRDELREDNLDKLVEDAITKRRIGKNNLRLDQIYLTQGTLEDYVPRLEEIEAIEASKNKAIENNKGGGFMQWLGGLFGMEGKMPSFINLLLGVFDWIMGGFGLGKNSKGLKECIAERAIGSTLKDMQAGMGSVRESVRGMVMPMAEHMAYETAGIDRPAPASPFAGLAIDEKRTKAALIDSPVFVDEIAKSIEGDKALQGKLNLSASPEEKKHEIRALAEATAAALREQRSKGETNGNTFYEKAQEALETAIKADPKLAKLFTQKDGNITLRVFTHVATFSGACELCDDKPTQDPKVHDALVRLASQMANQPTPDPKEILPLLAGLKEDEKEWVRPHVQQAMEKFIDAELEKQKEKLPEMNDAGKRKQIATRAAQKMAELALNPPGKAKDTADALRDHLNTNFPAGIFGEDKASLLKKEGVVQAMVEKYTFLLHPDATKADVAPKNGMGRIAAAVMDTDEAKLHAALKSLSGEEQKQMIAFVKEKIKPVLLAQSNTPEGQLGLKSLKLASQGNGEADRLIDFTAEQLAEIVVRQPERLGNFDLINQALYYDSTRGLGHSVTRRVDLQGTESPHGHYFTNPEAVHEFSMQVSRQFAEQTQNGLLRLLSTPPPAGPAPAAPPPDTKQAEQGIRARVQAQVAGRIMTLANEWNMPNGGAMMTDSVTNAIMDVLREPGLPDARGMHGRLYERIGAHLSANAGLQDHNIYWGLKQTNSNLDRYVAWEIASHLVPNHGKDQPAEATLNRTGKVMKWGAGLFSADVPSQSLGEFPPPTPGAFSGRDGKGLVT